MNKPFLTLVLLFAWFITLAQAPTGLSSVGYRTTVHLKWDNYTAFQPAGYNIYRSTVSGSYGAPARRVGAYDNYTDYNLSPSTTYFYKISAFDAAGNESPLSQEITVSTNNNNYLKVASLDLLVPIYTGSMTANEPDHVRQALEVARLFYYRNSKGQLNLKFHFMEIPGLPPPNNDGVADFGTIGTDLHNRGILDNQYDAIHVAAYQIYGWFGGAMWLGQTAGSMAHFPGYSYNPNNHYTTGDFWVFTHEFGHSLDLLADQSGHPEMLFNHYPWAFPLPAGIASFDIGPDYDGMAMVLRLFNHHLNYAAPWDGYFEVLDSDGDGLANNDLRLPMDEVRFGSNANAADTDGDGLNDLQEFYAGNLSSANPTNTDSDGDGISDGNDPFPVSNFRPTVLKTTASVNIDGSMATGEGWQPLVSNPFFSLQPGNTFNVSATWDDTYLYFAFQGNTQMKYYLYMDGSGEDGLFSSPIRFPGGNYNDINDAAYGDSYYESAVLIIRSDASQVWLKNAPVAGSQIATANNGGNYTTEVRIPHNLGQGFGWTYTPPTAPVVTTQSYTTGDIIGVNPIALPLANANSYETDDWRGGPFVSMNEVHHFYDMTLTATATANYCASTSSFPWEDWIAKVKVGTIDNPSGKSPYSDFTNLSTNLTFGNNPVELTTGFSYFTWDEYWRVWVDLNHDGDFDDAGEVVLEQIKTAPPAGTATNTLTSNIFISPSALTGPTRMRVSMKRGAYPSPCETLPFGEVEDYTVNIQQPAALPNLVIPNYEVIPNNFSCYADPGQTFGFLGGLVLNSGSANAGPFLLKVSFSKDNQHSADDTPWQFFQFNGLAPSSVVSFSLTNLVPSTLAPGKYFVIMRVDSENNVAELNENDNLIATQVNIGAPDFIVSNLAGIPASQTAGGNISFSATVANTSPFPLLELQGTLGLKVYLSADNQFSFGSDVEIGTGTLAYNQFSNGPLYNPGIATANLSSQLPAGTSAGNYFIFVVVTSGCEVSGANNVSSPAPIQITTGQPGTYCTSFSNFPWEDWIAKVELANLSNPSGKSLYSDFTSQSANVQPGNSYSITLTSGFSYFTWDEYWRVWIDFNRDGVFSTPDELVQQRILTAPAAGTPTASVMGSVAIPSWVTTGPTRMRVSMKRGAYPSSCETLPFGEVEDYTVNVTSGGPGCNVQVSYTNVQCQDNNTPLNPLDDGFTFDLLALGSGTSANWLMTWNGGSTSGTFGVSKTVGPFSIATFQSVFNFTVADAAQTSCSATGSLIPPPPCSVPPAACGFTKTYQTGTYDNVVHAAQTSNGYKVIASKSLTAGLTFNTLNTDQDGNQTGSFTEGVIDPFSYAPVWLRDGNYAFLSVITGNVIKLEKRTGSGTSLWSNTYTVPNVATIFQLGAVYEAANGELYITGEIDKTTTPGTVPELLMLKVNSGGTQQWLTTTVIGTPAINFAPKIFSVGSSGNTIVRLYFNDETKYIAKVAGNGTLLWNVNVGGVFTQAMDATEGTDGSVLVATTSIPGGGPGSTTSAFTKLAAADGTTLWSKTAAQLGGATPIQFTVYVFPKVVSIPGGGYAIAFLFNEALVLSGVDPNGNMTWTKKHTQLTQSTGSIGHFTRTNDGGYLLAGTLANGLWLMKTDDQGNICETPTPGPYCTSTSNFPWEDWIARVKVNTLDNSSGKSPYSDFTALSTNLQKGVDYTMTLTTGFSYFTWDEYWKVWIDLNHDGVFQEPEEVVLTQILSAPANGTATASVTGAFKLSNTALNGPTRMRVSMKRGGFAMPCETLAFGEVEDYTVNIVNMFNSPELDNRAANLTFEAVREKTGVNLYGAFHFSEPVVQIEVEKSTDGLEYTVLETLQGKATPGNSQVVQLHDAQPNDGFNFYRMLILLENGEEVYSPVRIVSFDAPLDFTIFPNPANSEVFIHLTESPDADMLWNINDAYGRVVWTQKIAPDTAYPYRLDVQALEPGMYYLFVMQPGRRTAVRRFVVVR